ncbi:MAG: DNA double-strand break repair nuclease NurA [Candidatus Hodarchaeota archaeon]
MFNPSDDKMWTTVNTIAAEIRKIEKDKSGLASIIKDAKAKIDLTDLRTGFSDILEDRLYFSVSPTNLGGLRVGAVDGGVVGRSFHGIDLIITRAIAVIFDFDKRGKPFVEYYPQECPPPQITSNLEALSLFDFELDTSLERIRSELTVAKEVLDLRHLDILFMDGSITPIISDRPQAHSAMLPKYDALIRLYEELYDNCQKQGTLLCGIVKDSRSTRFTQILGSIIPHLMKQEPALNKLLELDYRKTIFRIRDTDLLYRILNIGERSFIFNYLKNVKSHPALRDFENKNWPKQLHAFYLKTVEYDRPLRIEFLTFGNDASRVADRLTSVILPLSSHHAEYGLPTVLVEADTQARLLENDLDIVYERLIEQVGLSPSMLRLRRDKKPF